MFTQCPKCKSLQTVEYAHLEESSEIECKNCHSLLSLNIVAELVSPPESAHTMDHSHSLENVGTQNQLPEVTGQTKTQKTVLVCIDGEATREVIVSLLEESGYNILDIPSGNSAFLAMKSAPPELALIDEGNTDIPGTSLCTQVKAYPGLSETSVILVGSIFGKNTKYRDEPLELYGADDHIDRARIQKELLSKIKTLLAIKYREHGEGDHSKDPETEEIVHTDDTGKVTVSNQSEDALLQAPEALPTEDHLEPEMPVEHEDQAMKSAKRLARVIVQDIVAYNRGKVEEGLQTGTFYEILEEEIMQGRRVFETRAPAYFDSSLYEDEIDHFVASKGGKETRAQKNAEEASETQLQDEIQSSEPLQEAAESEIETEEVEDASEPEPESPSETFQTMDNLAEAALQETAESEIETEEVQDAFEPEPESPGDIFLSIEKQTKDALDSSDGTKVEAHLKPENVTEQVSHTIKNAKRLAKVIISDIVIYNEKKVEKGLQTGTFYEILKDEINEGRQLYESRIPHDLIDSGLYENELEAFIKTREGTTDSVSSESKEEPEYSINTESPLDLLAQEPDKVKKETHSINISEGKDKSKEHKNAKRLARIIVSDIVIYNEKKVQKGLQTGTFYEILESDIKEGRHLYESRVSRQILEEENYLDEAFEAFISEKTASIS